MLRSTYWNLRLNSLGKRPDLPNDPLVIVQHAVAIVKKGQPEADLDYDEAFFKSESKVRERGST